MVVDNLSSMHQSPEEDDKEQVDVEVQCRWKPEHKLVIRVLLEDWLEWKGGTPRLIQSVFPYLNADQREILISGTCPTCWANLFPKEDDE
jgi:hypothetical protein